MSPRPSLLPPPTARSLAALLAGLALAAAAVPPAAAQDAAAPGAKPAPKKVRARAFLSTDKLPAGRTAEVAVVLDVAPGWHVNGNPAPSKYAVPTTVTVKTARGTEVGAFRFPTRPPAKKGGDPVPVKELAGRVVLRAPVRVPAEAAGGEEKLIVTVRYQACDAAQCLRPTWLSFGGTLPVAAPGEPVRPANAEWFPKESDRDGGGPASRSAATRTAER